MLFNSAEYGIFFAVVFVLYWLLSGWATPRLLLLLVASYLFYASWSWEYLFLIILSSLIDYVIGLGLGSVEHPGGRKALLMVSLVANLGMLGVFKYFNFFMGTLDDAATLAHLAPLGLRLDLLLPVGISFYTFQTMSYSIDLYQRKIDVCYNPLKFLVYVSFFPQLVAGPIVRASDFLYQLNQRPTLTGEAASRAVVLIMAGLFKKVVIGDYLAVNIVDRVFDTPQMFSSLETLLGVYGYAMQIFCDFSGYTDIAIGSALLLGFGLPENFKRPYKADSLQDFWHRWHISLSSWLRDYLYISLGGNRSGAEWKTYRNLMLTMLLGGLWHGAAWNFIIWGALHGGALAATRIWQRWRRDRDFNPTSPLYRAGAIFLTFHFVCLTWVFFRSPTFSDALAIFESLGALTLGVNNVAPTVALALAGGFALHLSPDGWYDHLEATYAKAPVLVQGLLLALLVLLLDQVATSEVVPFIYFQF